MKRNMFLIFMIAFTIKVFSVSNDEMAISYYLLAEEEYNKQNYDNAIKNLNEAKKLLKTTNPKIQILLVNTLFNTKKYAEAEKELDIYFSIVTENDKNSSSYFDMVKMIAKIKELKENEEKIKENQNAEWKEDAKKIREKKYPDYKYHSEKDGVEIYYKKIKAGSAISFLIFNTKNYAVKIEGNIRVYWTDLKNMRKDISYQLEPCTGLTRQFTNNSRAKYNDAEIEISVSKIK